MNAGLSVERRTDHRRATQAGFVAGMPMVAGVIVAGPDLPVGGIDMRQVGGRTVAVGGNLLVDSEDSTGFVMAVYDLDHPLAPALLPLSTVARSGPVPRTFTGTEMVRYGWDTRKVLDLVHAFTQHPPAR